jgi:hypothetical protein
MNSRIAALSLTHRSTRPRTGRFGSGKPPEESWHPKSVSFSQKPANIYPPYVGRKADLRNV